MSIEDEEKAFIAYTKLLMGGDSKLIEPLCKSKELPFLLHISSNKNIKQFIPSVSRRTLTKEDRRMPRVCTSDSLWGCMVGYSAIVGDFENNTLGEDGWSGGYQIYGLPFKVAGVPKKKLLDDVKLTDEKWLIGYNEQHRVIEPLKVGKLFMKAMTTTNGYSAKDNKRSFSIDFYLHVTTPFQLVPGNTLAEGYYKFVMSDQMSWVYWDKGSFTSTEISRSEWLAAKGVTAGLLSYETQLPSSSW